MVRRCVVHECKESDKTILAHRFPKTGDMAMKWRNALDVHEFTIDDLTKKFVVCTKHFTESCYRNEISNSLNTTSVPNLNANNCNPRISLKPDSSKKSASLAYRCHSLPQPGKCSSSRFKKIKLDLSLEARDEPVEDIIQIDDDEETFEIHEYTEDERMFNDEEITQTEHFIKPDAPSPLVAESSAPCQLNQETQTDPPPEAKLLDSVKVIAQVVNESKDDKLVSILYPEFQNFDRLQLIELVNEKTRKIESLEEKVKKLELAMRNLL